MDLAGPDRRRMVWQGRRVLLAGVVALAILAIFAAVASGGQRTLRLPDAPPPLDVPTDVTGSSAGPTG
jgi:hypothetical protein